MFAEVGILSAGGLAPQRESTGVEGSFVLVLLAHTAFSNLPWIRSRREENKRSFDSELRNIGAIPSLRMHSW